jgi:uncharacterized protein YqkB
MTTALMSDKELAITLERTVCENYMMRVVVAMKGQVEFIEAETIPLLRVTLGFFDLSDHSRIHQQSPFGFEIKDTRKTRVFSN